MAMKTTLNLDDALLRAAKRSAVERGTTLTAVVEEALQRLLEPRRSGKKERFRWVVVDGRELPQVDVADRRALYDAMERRR